MNRLKEHLSVFVVKNPARAILIGILLLNVVLFVVAATVISAIATKSATHESLGFWASLYYTVTMVLDAGCIDNVVADIGQSGVALILVCIATVLLGMITFTGAVIGYVTNVISNFIENSKSGARALKVSRHTVILNWNSRASEIVNDLLFTGKRELVVVLVSEDAEGVEREIGERISATMRAEQKQLAGEVAGMSFFKGLRYIAAHRTKNRLITIVREGETYSTKQLNDIAIAQADTVILLTKDAQNSLCQYGNVERREHLEKGNANTLKTLVQVAQMTADDGSADNQKIIVEVEDAWTEELVNQIIAHKAGKEKQQKCMIVPIPVNKVLGQILSQFSIMPELNTVYSELFSNRGAEFFFLPHEWRDDVEEDMRGYMTTHHHAIPLTLLETASGNHAYFVANEFEDCEIQGAPAKTTFTVKVNPKYHLSPRNVVIVGHNSKSRDIMNGFDSFCGEHQLENGEILNITVIDDEKSLERNNYFQEYSYVTSYTAADIHDDKTICAAIEAAVDKHNGDTSILILSDDSAMTEDIDSTALTYLIYVQNIIQARIAKDPDFDVESLDVIVEILNPKNYDVVHNYSVNNVVISNRYISKMVTQVGRKQALFEFYSDILTYDEEGAESYDSKELYVKEVGRFFEEIPGPCTADELIRAVFDATPKENKAVVIGYVTPGGKTVVFSGDQRETKVKLTNRDKLIIFSNH